MTILPPIPGNADSCDALASALTASATRFAAAATDLHALRAGAVWEGPAGEAFAERAGHAGPALEAAADRYAACASAVRALAPVLADSQRRATLASRGHAEAVERYAVIEDEIVRLMGAGRTEADPEVIVLRASQHGCLVRQDSAAREHARAVTDLDAADEACARALQGAADDALADSALYRFVLGASSQGAPAEFFAVAGMILPPLGVAAGLVNTGADALLRTFWEEGGWPTIAINGALSGLGGWGRALKRGAVLGAVEDTAVTGQRTVRTVRTVRVTESWTTGARVRAGLKAEGRARLQSWTDRLSGRTASPWNRLLDGPTPTRLTGPVPTSARSVTGRADLVRGLPGTVARATEARVAAGTLGWRLAAANGGDAVKMYAAGATLERGATYATKVKGQVDKARERDDTSRSGEPR